MSLVRDAILGILADLRHIYGNASRGFGFDANHLSQCIKRLENLTTPRGALPADDFKKKVEKLIQEAIIGGADAEDIQDAMAELGFGDKPNGR